MQENWKTETTRVERIKVAGPIKESRQACDWLQNQGYRIVNLDCYRDATMPSYTIDPSRFLILAERSLEDG